MDGSVWHVKQYIMICLFSQDEAHAETKLLVAYKTQIHDQRDEKVDEGSHSLITRVELQKLRHNVSYERMGWSSS